MNWLIDNATSNLCGQDTLVWYFPDPGIVLSDGKMWLDWTGSGEGNSKVCGQMQCFGMFQKLLLYSQTVKWDWNELAHWQGNCNLCGQDALLWDFPDPGTVLSDGIMRLDWTGSGHCNSEECGQDALVWDGPEPVTVLSDGKMGLQWNGSLTRQLYSVSARSTGLGFSSSWYCTVRR